MVAQNSEEYFGNELLGTLTKGEAQGRFAQLDYVPPIYRAQIDEAVRAFRRGPLTIFAGDSITQNLNTLTNPAQPLYGESWATMLPLRSGQRILFGRNAGITNNTVQDLALRIDTDVIAYAPDRCVVLIGTNNMNQATPTLAQTMVDYRTRIIDPLIAAGIEPIVCTIPPRTGSRTSEPVTYRNTLRWNAFLRALANELRLTLVDTYAAVVDPATGDFKAGLSGDGVHPSKAGYTAMVDAALKALDRSYPLQGPPLEQDQMSSISLANNPLFLGGLAGTGNVLPTGWSGSTTGITVALEDGTTDEALSGKWFSITKTDTAATKNINQIRTLANMASAGNPVAVGDRVAWGFRYKLSGGAGATSGQYVTIAARYLDAANANTRIITPMNQFELESSGTVWFEGTVPPNTTSLRFDISFSTSSTQKFSIGQLTWRNLTALGLPSLTHV